jgi:hypothetical protein
MDAHTEALRTLGGSDALTEVLTRLKAAEDVCLVYGWSSGLDDSVRGRACYMLWRRWFDLVPEGFCSPRAHPDLSDEELAKLSEARDDLRERTLRSLREAGG